MNDFIEEWNSPEPYITAHTSGSTGIPKPIRLLKSDMITSAKATNEFFGITSESILACPLSFDYIAGKMMAVRSIVANCWLIELPVSKNVSLQQEVDLLPVVPMQLDSIFRDSESLGKIRNLLIGGAPLSSNDEHLLIEKGVNAWVGYGMTETCSHVALRHVGDDVYHAMPRITFETDSRGCLLICSDRFSWSRLVTNDCVELVGSNQMRWLGRADNVINSGGIKLHPEKIEAEIRKLIPDMPDFYLCGEPDETLGMRLVMVAECEDESILEQIRSAITNHRYVPKRIICVDKLPRTASGKVIRTC